MNDDDCNDISYEVYALQISKLLKRALDNYYLFVMDVSPQTSKDYAIYQANCQSSVSHIHLLIKLSEYIKKLNAEAEKQECFDGAYIENLIKEAEVAVGANRK